MKHVHFFSSCASLALGMGIFGVLCPDAQARLIHESTAAAIAHREARAGVLAGSIMVEAPLAWRIGGDPVTVAYDPGFAERTNMPREARHEGPVRDRTPPGSRSPSAPH